MFTKWDQNSKDSLRLTAKGSVIKVKQAHIAEDFYKFRLTTIMVQKTRIKERGLHEFTSSDGKKVCLYNSGNGAKSVRVVGTITRESTNVKNESGRICHVNKN